MSLTSTRAPKTRLTVVAAGGAASLTEAWCVGDAVGRDADPTTPPALIGEHCPEPPRKRFRIRLVGSVLQVEPSDDRNGRIEVATPRWLAACSPAARVRRWRVSDASPAAPAARGLAAPHKGGLPG
jgi:hypothetical protein